MIAEGIDFLRRDLMDAHVVEEIVQLESSIGQSRRGRREARARVQAAHNG